MKLNSEKLPKVVCRKCGCKLFHRNYRAMGHWEQLVEFMSDGEAEVVDTFLDNLRYGTQPKTMKCADCRATNPNPSYKP